MFLNRPAVIFDLDGTLVQFKLKIGEAKKEFIETLELLGFDVRDMTPEMTVSELLAKLSARDGRGLNLANQTFFRILERYEIAAAMESEPRDGVYEVIEALRGLGIRIAVATNNCRYAAALSLKRVGLEGLARFMATRTETNVLKPNPAQLILAARLVKAPINMCIHVGDSHNDVIAARRCGALAIGLLGGVSPLDKLMESRPHLIIEHLKEVIDLFQKY